MCDIMTRDELMRDRRNIMRYIVYCICLLGLISESRGDFILWDDEQLDINTTHSQGILYDRSLARIVYDSSNGNAAVTNLYAYDSSTIGIQKHGKINYLHAYNSSITNMLGGGRIDTLNAYDTSTVNIFPGSWPWPSEAYRFFARDNSIVNISGGKVSNLYTFDTSITNISDGEISGIQVYGDGIVNISGGLLTGLSTYYDGTITFIGSDFRLGDGLLLDNGRVTGSGYLSGEWYDGTRWVTNISIGTNSSVILTPEPTTILLLALGSVLGIKRRCNK